MRLSLKYIGYIINEELDEKANITILTIPALLFFVFYDLLSTLAIYYRYDTFSAERNILFKNYYQIAGIGGFISLKIILSVLVIIIAINIFKSIDNGLGAGLFFGLAIAGLYAGNSNMLVVMTKHPASYFGMDNFSIIALLISSMMLVGYFGKKIKNKAGS